MAFSMRDFLKKGFLNAVGSQPDYWIVLNAAGYADKGVLTEDDLAEIQAAIDKKNTPVTEIPATGTNTDTDIDSENVDADESEPAP